MCVCIECVRVQANKLVCTYLLAGLFSLTLFDLSKARSHFAQCYLILNLYPHHISSVVVHRVYALFVGMNTSPTDRHFW
jgi:hypothetical protein